jgi:hypothetical protein
VNGTRLLVDVAYFVVVFLILIDVCLANTKFFQVSIEHTIPLRPLLLVLSSVGVIDSLRLFVTTVFKATDVIIFFLVTIVCTTLFAGGLNRGKVNVGITQSSFDDFVKTAITMFGFITTGDNYENVVLNTMAEVPANMRPQVFMFFAMSLIIGLFFVLSLMMVFFQNAFSESRQLRIAHANHLNRLALVCAFICIDQDNSGTVDYEEFQDFITAVDKKKSHVALATEEFYKHFNPEKVALDVEGFSAGVSETNSLFHTLPVLKWAEMRGRIRAKLETKTAQLLRLVLIIGYLCVLSLYGTAEKSADLDAAAFGFTGVFVVEIAVAVFAYGPREYWNFAHFNADIKSLQFRNRFDVLVVIPAFIAFGAIFAGGIKLEVTPAGNPNPLYPWLRFCSILPCLRLFSALKSIRRLVVIFGRVFPRFFPLLTLLVAVEMFYLNVGLILFVDRFTLLEPAPSRDFNDAFLALAVIMELFIGEDWNNTMGNAISSTNSWASSLYFLSHTFFILVVLTQLLLGMMLDVFKAIWDDISFQKKEEKAEFRKLRNDKVGNQEIVRRLRIQRWNAYNNILKAVS